MENMFVNFKFNEKTQNIVEDVNGLILPNDYVEFMKLHNGGEGNIGKNAYGCFFKMEELKDVNDEYDALNNWPGYIIIGSDMGANLWAYNPEKRIYCQIDSCNIDDDTYYTISNSLEEFLIKINEE